jgi:LPXTG-motif cell wall-anchored protein
VNKNDKKFGKSFPYVGLPTAGSRGKTVKGNTTNNVRSALGGGVEASGMDDTTLIATSAGAGAAGVLLIGTGLLWWRRRNDRAYY